MALVVPVVLLGCRRPEPPNAAVRTAPVDTVWYISTRARDQQGRDTRRLAESLEYGMVVSSVRSRGDPLVHSLDVAPIDSVQLTASEFAAAIRVRTRGTPSGDSVAVLMVHGFGTSLHEAWEYATEAHVRTRSSAPWVVFCWPSNGAGIAWPRKGQLFVRAYREDSASASASRSAFSEASRLLLSAVGGAHLLVVAHSMGSQVVGEAMLSDTALRGALTRDRLRTLAFFAPDVATQHFGQAILPAARPLARRLVVYAASDDRMLRLSRTVNDNERAGLIRGKPVAFSGVEVVDATEGLMAESAVQRVIGSHHGIRRASAALFDLQIVAGRYTADCRAMLKTAVLEPAGAWKLTILPPPPLSALAACPREASN